MMLIVGANQLSAQSVNNGIFFQAVARDNFSNPAKERKIYVQSSVIQTTTNGPILLVEQFQVNTDGTGMFSISIGNGTRVGGTASGLNAIDWSQGPFFLNLKIAITPVAGNVGWDYTKEWVNIGTTSFGAVPYALYSANAGGVNQKLNITDTTKMLSIYAKSQAVQALSTTVDKKLSFSDTASMLVPYIRASLVLDSAYINTELKSKANTTDVNTALNLKANTADVTTSLNLKANSSDVNTSLATKVDKVNGKDLSTNDYTTAEKTKLSAITGTNTGDQTNITGNAATATKLATARNINGVAFDGSDDITLTANAGTLTGTTLASNVVNSSLTSVGTLTSGTISLTTNITTSGALKTGTVTYPNTHGTNGQVLSTTGSGTLTWASSGVPYSGATGAVNLGSYDLTVNGVVIGKGGNTLADNISIGNGARSGNINTGGNANIAIGTDAQKNNTGFYNVSVGNANLVNGSGDENTAIGYTVMSNNTTGIRNTGVGLFSFYQNTTGNYNTAIGHGSLGVNTTGSYNTALGTSADVATNNLTNATAIGNGAIVAASNTIQLGNTSVTNVKTSGTITAGAITFPNTTGTNGQVLTSNGAGNASWTTVSSGVPYTGATGAVNLGSYDLRVYGLTVGRGAGSISSNTAIGSSALQSNTTGNSNTSSGYNTLVYNTTGYLNTANGSGALFSNTTGYSNTAIGYNVLGLNTTGNSNTAIGESALYKNTTANFLTAVGTQSLYSNTTGYNNTAIGFYSLRENTTGGANTANGSWTLRNNTTGTANTANGSSSLQNNTTGNNNTGAGESSLYSNTTGYQNTANGAGALRANTTGYNNTATGYNALYSNTTAVSNNAYGSNALNSTTTGGGNNAFGFQSLYTNTIGSANTGYGQSTLYLNTTGSNNTAIGYSALDNNTTGSNNTAVGYDADVSSNNLSNATAIGNGAIVSASNTIQLGNTSVTNVKTSGTITAGGLGVGVNSPNASAILEASSTTQGFLPPRMTYAQRNLISNPANGLMIFCSDCGLYGEPQFYDGNNNWRKLDISLGSGSGTLNLIVDNLNGPTNATGSASVGQSFTTTSSSGRLIKIVTSALGGVTGTQLTNGIAQSYLRIRSYVNDDELTTPNALSGEILATSNTNPTILNYTYGANWPTVEFTFPNSIVLQANTRYVIQFIAGGGVWAYVKITGSYSGGQAYDLSGSNSSYVRDFPFQLYLQQY